MKVVDFCDIAKLESIVNNWSLVTGLTASVVDSDGKHIIKSESLGLTNKFSHSVELDEETVLCNITGGQVASEEAKSKDEVNAAVALLVDAVGNYITSTYYSTISTSTIDSIKSGISAAAEEIVKANDSTKLIAGFSNRQKILALNASIEAARAGEAGRGFAVVAEEVQKLAQGMAAASDDISRELASIEDIVNGLNK